MIPIKRTNGNATLKPEEVRHIRKLARDGMTTAAIARVYMVGTETIRRVVRRDTWAWLADEVETTPLPDSPEVTQQIAASKERFLKMLAEEQEKQARGDNLLGELKGEQDGQASAGKPSTRSE